MGNDSLDYMQILGRIASKFTMATGQSISFISRCGEWQTPLNLESFTPFCRRVISSEKGRKMCCECNNAFQLTDNGNIDISQCHMGVSLISVPVKQEENDLLISYGQFLLAGTETHFFQALPGNCTKLGIDYKELRPMADHLRIFTHTELKDKIELLKLFSNYANVMENEYRARQRYYREYQEKLRIENRLSALEFDSANANVTQTFIVDTLAAISNAAYQEHAGNTGTLICDLLHILLKSSTLQGISATPSEKQAFVEEFRRFQGAIAQYSASAPNVENADSDNNRIIYKVCSIIRARYAEEISLDTVANEFHISPMYLSRIFKKETGKNFKEYLIDIRMNEAQKLLRDPGLSVGEVACRVGYDDPSYFSRSYKKKFGYSPRQKNAKIAKK